MFNNSMKQLTIILLSLIGIAYGQSQPTSAKTRFVNGLYMGTKLDSYFNTADSNAIYWRADSVVMAKYKGAARALAFDVAGGYVPYTGATQNVTIGNFRVSARTLLGDSIMARGSGGIQFYTNSGAAAASYGGGGSTVFNFNNDIIANGLTVGRGGGSNANNTAVGENALVANTTGGSNSAFGRSALASNISGNSSSAFGRSALASLSSGSDNTALGFNALGALATGSNNIGIGSGAGNLTNGGASVTALTSSIIIGDDARPSANSNTNETVIGFQSRGNGSNTVTIGNSSVTGNYFNGFLKQTSVTSALVKASASGQLEAAVAGTDYVAPSALSGYLPLTGGALTGNLTSSGAITLNNGQYYQAKRNTGSAVVNVLGFESGTDDLIQVTSNDWKLRNTGTGDAANILKITNAGVITAYGALNGTSAAFSGAGSFGTTLSVGSTATSGQLSLDGASSDAWSSSGASSLVLNGNAAISTITTFLDNSSLRIGAGVTQKTGIFINGHTATGGSYVSVTSGNAEAARFTANRNLLIKTTTDNGTDALQVNGSASFTGALNGTSAAFSGGVSIASGNNLTWGGAYGANIPTLVGISGATPYLAIYAAGSTSSETDRFTANGTLLIKTAVDNGTDALQVAGSAYASGEITTGSVARAFLRQTVGGDIELGAKTGGTTAIWSNNTAAVTFSTSQAATFSSTVRVDGQVIYYGGANTYIQGDNSSLFLGTGGAAKLTIASTGAATFSSSVTASSLIKSGGTSSQALIADGSVLTLTSGTYTPTITNGTNVSSSTSNTAQYSRVGDVVTVSGEVSITTTSNSTLTDFQISLPIASNFSTRTNCGGVARYYNATDGDGVSMAIIAEDTNDRAKFIMKAPAFGSGGGITVTYQFTYRVI